MDTPHSSPSSTSTAAHTISATPTISRRTLLKSAALAAGAVAAAPATLALAASPATRIAAPYVKRSPEGQIVIWDRAGDLYHVFDATIASFNKKYPGITVKHVSVDVDAKLPTTLTTGVGVPDGAFYEDSNLPILGAHFYDITEWIHPYVADIVPFKVRVNTQHGRIVGVPWDLDPGLLFYREDLLHKAGIDPRSITTYDALLSAARTARSKLGSTVRPIHVEQDPALTVLQLEMFANQQGTSMVNAAGKLQVSSPPYVRAVQWLKQVMDEGLGTRTAYTGPGDINALETGQEIFVPWAIWFTYAPSVLLKKTTGLWRSMPLPAWTAGGARGGVMGGSSFVIPKQAKNPRLAWLWYEHLVFSPDGYRAVYGPNAIYPGGLDTSIPSYKPALTQQLFKNPAGLGGQNLWAVATSAARDIPSAYYYPTWYNQAVPYLGGNVQQVLDGSLTPQHALTQAAQAIQTNLINRA